MHPRKRKKLCVRRPNKVAQHCTQQLLHFLSKAKILLHNLNFQRVSFTINGGTNEVGGANWCRCIHRFSIYLHSSQASQQVFFRFLPSTIFNLFYYCNFFWIFCNSNCFMFLVDYALNLNEPNTEICFVWWVCWVSGKEL